MEPDSRKIHLVRHGESEWNRVRRVQGDAFGVVLSERGREQARLLGERLRTMHFDHIFSSDVERAAETTRIALGDSYDVKYTNDLREISFGEWEGRLVTEIKEEFPGDLENWFACPSKVRIKGACTTAG